MKRVSKAICVLSCLGILLLLVTGCAANNAESNDETNIALETENTEVKEQTKVEETTEVSEVETISEEETENSAPTLLYMGQASIRIVT